MHNYTARRRPEAPPPGPPADHRPFFAAAPDAALKLMSFAIIIVIGWLYVTILVAANEPTLVSGLISFLFYGALPCGLILYFAGSKVRRQRRQFLEAQARQAAAEEARE